MKAAMYTYSTHVLVTHKIRSIFFLETEQKTKEMGKKGECKEKSFILQIFSRLKNKAGVEFYEADQEQLW